MYIIRCNIIQNVLSAVEEFMRSQKGDVGEERYT